MAGLMLLSLVSCNRGGKQETDTEVSETNALTSVETTSETETKPEEDDSMIYPKEGDVIVLANDEVYEWWSDYHMKRTDSKPYYRHEDIYYPNSVTFSWEGDEKADYYSVFISTDANFAEDKSESYLVNSNSLTLSHLHTGTKYYWTVIATEVADDGSKMDTCAVSKYSFTTAKSPRCLRIDGVVTPLIDFVLRGSSSLEGSLASAAYTGIEVIISAQISKIARSILFFIIIEPPQATDL